MNSNESFDQTDIPNDTPAAPTQDFAPPPQPKPPIPIRRSRNRIIAGVVSGLAERIGMDVTAARLLTVVALVFSAGTVAIAYAAAWLLMPGPDNDVAPVARWQHQPTPQG